MHWHWSSGHCGQLVGGGGGGSRLPSCSGGVEGCPGLGTLPPPTVRPWGRRPGPAVLVSSGAGRAGVRARHHTRSARSRGLALCATGAARGRPGGGAPPDRVWGVQGWALSLPQPPVHGAGGRGPLPVFRGRGGCGRGDPSPTPQRALLRGGSRAVGRHEGARGGRLLPGCGASGVECSATPDRPSLGRAAGARYPLVVGAGGVGMGTRHQPHSARSCELVLRAVGATRGRPGVGSASCLGAPVSNPSSTVTIKCQQQHLSVVCPAHIPFPSAVKKHSTSTVTVGVAIQSCCSSTTWASSCPNSSARGKGSASSDPSNANHVDKLGLPALCVLSAKSMYTSCGACPPKRGGIHTYDNMKLWRYAALGLLHAVQLYTLLHHVLEVEEGPATSPSQARLEHHRLRPLGDEGLADPPQGWPSNASSGACPDCGKKFSSFETSPPTKQPSPHSHRSPEAAPLAEGCDAPWCGGFPQNCPSGFLQHVQALMAPLVGQSPTRCQVELGHTRAKGVKNFGQVARGHFPINRQCTTMQHAITPIVVSRTVLKTN